MYLIRKNIITENNIEKVNGYWVDEKINGQLIESFFIQLDTHKTCSCKYFTESKNPRNHFHILLVENWIRNGCPKYAIYIKNKKGKIETLCPGYIETGK